MKKDNKRSSKKLFKRKFLKSNLAKSNKGFSVIETIVTMAIVIAVSVATITLIKQSHTAGARCTMDMEVRGVVSNALEIFKYTDNLETFTELIDTLDIEEENIALENNTWILEYPFYRLTFSVHFGRDSTFFAHAFSDKGEKVIDVAYTKR